MNTKIILALLLPLNCFGAPIELNNKFSNKIFVKTEKIEVKGVFESKQKILKHKKKIKTIINSSTQASPELEDVKNMDKENSLMLKKYLDRNSIASWDFSNQFDVKTGTAIKAYLLNSVVSSNLESPILAETTEGFEGIPEGSKFSCVGITKNKRVLTVCNRLITVDDEYEVETILLNPDGTAGLMGKTYSGKEQYAVGAITAATLKQGLDVSLDRLSTPFGAEAIATTAKNKIKSGGIGALDEIIQMNTDEYKTQEPKISINAGTKVLIYFTRRFKI